ncbi:hypothetical protein QR98_0022190 [Sarcoptes scabiei]|uniref:Uncharacterized protein n=1 Tax=Sarcoptes scabiei TaxID=52283 RepID=A0A131ZZR1_SARSC|nr:hypothetical protein QR98_0022190 [Sarcoptes scabiei]
MSSGDSLHQLNINTIQNGKNSNRIILWNKISPDLCLIFRRTWSFLSYITFIYCCCCISIRWMPKPPSSLNVMDPIQTERSKSMTTGKMFRAKTKQFRFRNDPLRKDVRCYGGHSIIELVHRSSSF